MTWTPLSKLSDWANVNDGLITLIIFFATIMFGWISGIFSALRHKPKFKISLIPGPTFCCTYLIGKRKGDYEIHRTGIALYLEISNTGSAPSSIGDISIAYHWNLNRWSLQWLRYSIGWFWLTNQTVCLEDFQAKIGSSVKIYPFLTQRNNLSPHASETYLEVGRSVSGIVYFEQADSWGGCFPAVHKDRVEIKVCVMDVFGRRHTSKFSIPSATLIEARKFSPSFGKTAAELTGEPLPFDILAGNIRSTSSA